VNEIESAASTNSQRSWEEPVAITEVQHNSESEHEEGIGEEAKTSEQIIDMAQQEPSLASVMETMLRLMDSNRKADNYKAKREEDDMRRWEHEQLAEHTIDKVPPMTEKDDIELYIATRTRK